MAKPEIQTQKDTIQTPDLTKRQRGRVSGGVTFPRNPLKEALEVAKAIWLQNAGEPFDPILLAQSLGTTHRSSKFTTLSASTQRYGLTDGGEFAKAIRLTELGKAIVAPTDEALMGVNLRRALLFPKVFEQIYSKYDRKNIPKEEIVKSVLEVQYGIPRADVKACYDIMMQNISDYKLAIKTGESEILYLDNLGKSIISKVEESTDSIPQEETIEQASPHSSIPQPPPTEQIPKVFISHSKNQNIIEQLKTILEFGSFQYTIAEEVETAAIPIPDKIFGLMRECNCAIINVSADEEMKQADGSYRINENVLIEIGAAFVHYNKRVILLVDKRLKLPSNLQGLYRCEYEGDELSFMVAMKLQKALTEFKKTLD